MSVHFRHGQWVEAEAGEYGERLDLGADPNALTASRPGAEAAPAEPAKAKRSRKKADPRESQGDQ